MTHKPASLMGEAAAAIHQHVIGTHGHAEAHTGPSHHHHQVVVCEHHTPNVMERVSVVNEDHATKTSVLVNPREGAEVQRD